MLRVWQHEESDAIRTQRLKRIVESHLIQVPQEQLRAEAELKERANAMRAPEEPRPGQLQDACGSGEDDGHASTYINRTTILRVLRRKAARYKGPPPEDT